MAYYIEYDDPAWTYVYVPPYSYDDEPLGFYVNPTEHLYTGTRSYDDSIYEIRKRRYALEDWIRDDDLSYTPLPRDASPRRHRARSSVRDYIPISEYTPRPRFASPTRRRARSSVRDYVPVRVPEYTPPPVASLPVHRKSPYIGKYARQLRFDSRASWVPFASPKEDEFAVNLDLKSDALNRGLLRRDIDTALRSSYANKGRSEVRSKRDFALSELQRLDRKQAQISKNLTHFKRDILKAKHQSQYRNF
ncbi:uncharacterized protein LOC133197086 [Saccostrea echinata]|uniref:uncharacterized protein LOC133197086 n=1 Tax=Saccostrea echinata TaxID=191078 RepID=UPI002A814A96|nr:uncharacterized protein LOC133197086 [Saccostrea echinata]